jgi:hypothetical protein
MTSDRLANSKQTGHNAIRDHNEHEQIEQETKKAESRPGKAGQLQRSADGRSRIA